MENFIVKTGKLSELPSKKMKRGSKVNKVLATLVKAAEPGGFVQFDPRQTGVSELSLRSQLRTLVQKNVYSKGTRIVARGKEWFLIRGEE